jgi:hypothetical protein
VENDPVTQPAGSPLPSSAPVGTEEAATEKLSRTDPELFSRVTVRGDVAEIRCSRTPAPVTARDSPVTVNRSRTMLAVPLINPGDPPLSDPASM